AGDQLRAASEVPAAAAGEIDVSGDAEARAQVDAGAQRRAEVVAGAQLRLDVGLGFFEAATTDAVEIEMKAARDQREGNLAFDLALHLGEAFHLVAGEQRERVGTVVVAEQAKTAFQHRRPARLQPALGGDRQRESIDRRAERMNAGEALGRAVAAEATAEGADACGLAA